MPRPATGCSPAKRAVRVVIGKLCFAAAAHAAGDVWGVTRLERLLSFNASCRPKTSAETGASNKKRLPTNCCKRWRCGHVPRNLTLRLIARKLPHVASAMQAWRDGALAHVIQTESPADVSDTRTAASAFGAVNESLWGDYLAWKVFGKCNPVLEERLLANTLLESFRSAGLPLLTAVLALDQQMNFPRRATSERCVDAALGLLLEQTSAASPEIAYVAEDLKALRSQRIDQLKREAAGFVYQGKDSPPQQKVALRDAPAEVAAIASQIWEQALRAAGEEARTMAHAEHALLEAERTQLALEHARLQAQRQGVLYANHGRWMAKIRLIAPPLTQNTSIKP